MQYLKDAFGEGGLLRELLQILGVWIVIGGKVGFEHAQLLVLERRPQPLRLLLLVVTATIADYTQHGGRCVHQVTITVLFPFYYDENRNGLLHVIQSSLLPSFLPIMVSDFMLGRLLVLTRFACWPLVPLLFFRGEELAKSLPSTVCCG